jgi:hypothetical protein
MVAAVSFAISIAGHVLECKQLCSRIFVRRCTTQTREGELTQVGCGFVIGWSGCSVLGRLTAAGLGWQHAAVRRFQSRGRRLGRTCSAQP